MKRLALTVFVLAMIGPVAAAPWEFGPVIDVTTAQGPGLFHHLDSSGRKNIVVSGGVVAVTWEDNRGGTPETFVAFKSLTAASFSLAQRLSQGRPAYEPTVAPLDDGRFALGWEEADDLWLRIGGPHGLGPVTRLAKDAGQLNLAGGPGGELFGVWSQRGAAHSGIKITQLDFDRHSGGLRARRAHYLDGAAPRADQSYPAVAATDAGVTVAWEDRRHGHTVLLMSHARPGEVFSAPRLLNEQPPRMSAIFGRGTGVARVVLAAYGERGVAAAWLDKRDFTSGYDVYAGLAAAGDGRFGGNQKVQDEFGNAISQWHVAIAGHRAGDLVVVWQDDRDGTLDLWMAWPEDGGWSADHAVPGASGLDHDSNPAIALDAAGDLHLAWVQQAGPDRPTRLRYLVGRRARAGGAGATQP